MCKQSRNFLKHLLSENLDFIKTKIKDATLTSFCNYKANPPRNLSDEEFEAFQNLSKSPNLGIQIQIKEIW